MVVSVVGQKDPESFFHVLVAEASDIGKPKRGTTFRKSRVCTQSKYQILVNFVGFR